MKKIRLLSLILALCMVIAMFAACDDDEEYYVEEDEEEEETADTGETTAPTETQPQTEPSTAPETVPQTVPPTEPATQPQPSRPDPAPVNEDAGVWTGYTYTNEYMGFQLQFDSGWTIFYADELEDQMNEIGNQLSGVAPGGTLSTFMDMNVIRNTDSTDIAISYTKQNTVMKLLFKNLSESDALSTVLTLGESAILDSYEAQGITVTSLEKVSVTFLGKTRYALKATGTDTAGTAVYSLQLVSFALGDWITITTVNTYCADTTQAVLDMFKAL